MASDRITSQVTYPQRGKLVYRIGGNADTRSGLRGMAEALVLVQVKSRFHPWHQLVKMAIPFRLIVMWADKKPALKVIS